MKNTLLNLLARLMPSQIIIDNCIELIQREQVGLVKYGVSLTDAKLTHEQVLQHLLEEQLDAANYTRKALMTASQAHVDYVMLRREMEASLKNLEHFRGNFPATEDGESTLEYAYQRAIDDAQEELKNALFRFDSEKVRRDLRK